MFRKNVIQFINFLCLYSEIAAQNTACCTLTDDDNWVIVSDSIFCFSFPFVKDF